MIQYEITELSENGLTACHSTLYASCMEQALDMAEFSRAFESSKIVAKPVIVASDLPPISYDELPEGPDDLMRAMFAYGAKAIAVYEAKEQIRREKYLADLPETMASIEAGQL